MKRAGQAGQSMDDHAHNKNRTPQTAAISGQENNGSSINAKGVPPDSPGCNPGIRVAIQNIQRPNGPLPDGA
jgi:hypothetical protein